MTLTRRVVIFPSDVGFEIRYNIVRWRKYLCKRLEAAGIEFICPVGAHEPLPTGNYRWSRFHDGTLTIEQDIPPCPELSTLNQSESLGNRLQRTEASTDLIAVSKPQSKWSKPKKKQSKKKRETRALAKSNGISQKAFKQRVYRGWTPEDAATKPLCRSGRPKKVNDYE